MEQKLEELKVYLDAKFKVQKQSISEITNYRNMQLYV